MNGNAARLVVLPGDGIGPEVVREARRVVDWICEHRGFDLQVREDQLGYAAYERWGTPMRDETLAACAEADAILFGAQGGPEYEAIPIEIRREKGLLSLRKRLDLYANIRPARTFPGLEGLSSLRPEVVEGADLVVLRELTSGTYFGEPRGIRRDDSGREYAINTTYYDTDEIERVARVGFEVARSRSGRLHSVDKANVMEVGQLWRRVVQRLHDDEFPDVELTHMYADNCAMQLVRWPKQFDVIVTDNLFGDLLSDCSAMVAGSLGMLPSASLGAPDPATGRRTALYEPVHGSAPDIAGQGKANPIAELLSFAMLLRYSFDMNEDADMVEKAVSNVLEANIRTPDIAGPGSTVVSTSGMGDALIAELDRLAA